MRKMEEGLGLGFYRTAPSNFSAEMELKDKDCLLVFRSGDHNLLSIGQTDSVARHCDGAEQTLVAQALLGRAGAPVCPQGMIATLVSL
jgi:hypothetical protein